MLWLLLVAIVSIIFYKLWKLKNYWIDRKIVHRPPVLICGNLWDSITGRKAFFDVIDDIYKEFPEARYVGVNQTITPVLLIKDAELIKQITIKDFDYFAERQPFTGNNEEADPLWSRNLFGARAHKWKELRPMLSPTFTGSKMKIMFSLIDACAQNFLHYFTKDGKNSLEIELKDAFSRYTNDVIATTAFGIECNSLEYKNNEFYLMGKDVTNFTGLRILKFFGFILMPKLMQYFGFKVFSKKSASFFVNVIKATIKERVEKNIVRQDLIKLLLDARKSNNASKSEEVGATNIGFAIADELEQSTQPKITDDDIYAQCLIFFFAAFDTVSDALSLTAYELACNDSIQERLRNEVDEAWEECNGKLSYDVLSKMKYMDMVVSESLRKWPPITFVDRCCLKPYTILPVSPGENPVKIEVGEIIGIPIRSIHMDKSHFPNPEKFDPERFNDDNKHNIKPGTYMPFGTGPRICIGSRFALMEIKTLLFYLLRHFEIVPNKKTQMPFVWSKTSFNVIGEHGNWVNFKRR